MNHVGWVRDIVRYPVKSMAGITTESALVGWHGLQGDRRFAFRRLGDHSNFPWLSASRLPELLLYQPIGLDESSGEPLPTHVRTPSGAEFKLLSAELDTEISERFGGKVELMQLKHGIFDEAAISVIGLETIAGIGRAAGVGADLDRRRFRANIIVETENDELFVEDKWVGGTLVFADNGASSGSALAVSVTMRDLRCVMVNLDPDTADKDVRVMKTIVQLNQNHAGVYGTVVRTGRVRIGDRVNLAVNEHV